VTGDRAFSWSSKNLIFARMMGNFDKNFILMQKKYLLHSNSVDYDLNIFFLKQNTVMVLFIPGKWSST